MTGSQTDRVMVPPYMTASSILLRLIAKTFRAWVNRKEFDPLDENYNAWFALRAIESSILEKGHCVLSKSQREQLASALEAVHQLEHDIEAQDTPPIDTCQCQTASDILDLITVMKTGKQDIAA